MTMLQRLLPEFDASTKVHETRKQLRSRRQSRREIEQAATKRGMVTGLVAGVVAGGIGMFILDPRTGRRRRALVRDKAVHLGHAVDDMVTESLPRRVDYFSGVARGISHRASSRVGQNGDETLDDRMITDRVLSIVFRDPDLPKGEVNINTVDGIVYLRGTLTEPSLSSEIEKRVRKVEGVRDVANLIGQKSHQTNAPDMGTETPSETNAG